VNSGIVNIQVGLAQPKPAESVVTKIQQLAGRTRFDPYSNFKFRLGGMGGASRVSERQRCPDKASMRTSRSRVASRGCAQSVIALCRALLSIQVGRGQEGIMEDMNRRDFVIATVGGLGLLNADLARTQQGMHVRHNVYCLNPRGHGGSRTRCT